MFSNMNEWWTSRIASLHYELAYYVVEIHTEQNRPMLEKIANVRVDL
jgi:hypothetical protein